MGAGVFFHTPAITMTSGSLMTDSILRTSSQDIDIRWADTMASVPQPQCQIWLFDAHLMTEGSVLFTPGTGVAVDTRQHLVLGWAMQERRWWMRGGSEKDHWKY